MINYKKISTELPHSDEKATRLYPGSEARILGKGGKQRGAKLAGVSRDKIDKAMCKYW